MPELNPVRETLMNQLTALSADTAKAREKLKFTARSEHYVDFNRNLWDAPTLTAWELYTGVLYENLQLGDLPDRDQVRIASPLWGFLSPSDRVPVYRMPATTKFDELGVTVSQYWKAPLKSAMEDYADDLVIDMRSSAYTGMWNPGNAGVSVRVFKENPEGGRSVVTHMAKATRGRVARHIISRGAQPASPSDVLDFLIAEGFKAELNEPAGKTKPWLLDVIVEEP